MPIFDDKFLDDLRKVGDPDADAVVAEHFAESDPQATPAELFDSLVRHQPGRPSPLSDYYHERPPWPPWARADLVARGQRLFEQWGPQILSCLLLASLPNSYAAAKGVQVLRLTGRLVEQPQRRLLETNQMVIDSMTAGGLDVGARGYLVVRRVRLMHAAVRWLIARDPRVHQSCDEGFEERWCEQWGLPINQEDTLGELMAFTVVIFDALERSGVAVSPADREAYLHTWNVVGYFLGIRPDLLPLDLATAIELTRTIHRRQFAASAAGRELATALMSLAADQTRPRFLAGLPHSTSRYLIGDNVADMLGMAPANWTRLLLGPARRVLALLSLGEQHDRLMRAFMARFNRALIGLFIRDRLKGHRPTFSLPRHLADRWSIPEAAAPESVPATPLAAGASGRG